MKTEKLSETECVPIAVELCFQMVIIANIVERKL